MANGPLEQALEETKNSAREQLQAASQSELDRLTAEFKSAWSAHTERIFADCLAELAWRIEAQMRGSLAASARREITSRLSQAARRLRQFENEQRWSQALVQSTDGFCGRAALFAMNQGWLELRASRGFEIAPDNKIALAEAPAFASAVETQDPVVALRTGQELSAAIASAVGETSAQRCHLFPLTTRDRVPAILYADSDDGVVDVSALELLSTMAGSVLDGVGERGGQVTGLHQIPVNAKPGDDLHLRAQRFARVKVAEMRLHKAQAVVAGRTQRDLYSHLKHDIDAGREAFGHDFMERSDSMTDYFHQELVRTLANDDVSLLGPGYPGPMG
ncbi:MAG: hypothetical protein JO022_00250 [Acidobacteriaceae bacterium]|nr:hypothetical protein [Acidobacteriaceae bacterium]